MNTKNQNETKLGQRCNKRKPVFGIFLVLTIASSMENQVFAQTESNNSSLVVAKGVSSDGSVYVTITSIPIETHQQLALQVSFTDSQGNKILHENYGTTAVQQESNGITILSNYTAYAENGNDLQVTLPLDNPSPVNFQIQLQGAGLPGTNPSTWKGQIDTVGITVVPEFGTMVPVIFAMSFMIILFLIRRSGINFLQFGKQTGI